MRGCLLYNANGSVLFPAAAVGVVYDPATNAQSFHIGHRGDVISMAVTDNGLVAATGDSHAQPQVRVWDAMTGQTLAVLPRVAQQRRGISALAFSRDGKWCASVGQDTHHTVAAFTSYNGQWSDALRVATTATSTQKVLFALFIGPVDFPLMLGGTVPPPSTSSIIHHPPPTIHHPPSTIHHPPSTIHHPPPTIHHPPSTIHHPPSTTHHGHHSPLTRRQARGVPHPERAHAHEAACRVRKAAQDPTTALRR